MKVKRKEAHLYYLARCATKNGLYSWLFMGKGLIHNQEVITSYIVLLLCHLYEKDRSHSG